MTRRNLIGFIIAIVISGLFYGIFIRNENPEKINSENKNEEITIEEKNNNTSGKESFEDIRISKDSTEVQIKRLEKGEGKEAEKGDKIEIHYIGRLEDGTKFDSSRDRGEPLNFVIGAKEVVPGMEIGVEGMKVGERRRIFIPPLLGYGDNKKGPIPANSILVFDVELLSIN